MKTNLFALILLFLSTLISAQTTFKKGYYKTLNGVEKNVYIQSFEKEIPDFINYKNSLEDDSIEKISTQNLSEIIIPNQTKLIRENLYYEPLQKAYLSKNRNTKEFQYEKKNKLTKVVLETKNITVLKIIDANKNSYFFVKNKDSISLLEYKETFYEGKKIKIRNYRNYLYKNYNIQNSNNNKILNKIHYNENDIIKYFKNYSSSNNMQVSKYTTFQRDLKDAFDISVNVGYSFFNTNLISESPMFNSSFSTFHPSLGINFEYYLNNSIKNFSTIISFNYFLNSSSTNSFAFGAGNPNNSTINSDFSAFSGELLFRKYFSLGRNKFLFINTGIGLISFTGNSDYIFDQTNTKYVELNHDNDLEGNIFLSLGLGFNYKKFNLTANYSAFNGDFKSNNTSATSADWSYEKSNFNINISYILF